MSGCENVCNAFFLKNWGKKAAKQRWTEFFRFLCFVKTSYNERQMYPLPKEAIEAKKKEERNSEVHNKKKRSCCVLFL